MKPTRYPGDWTQALSPRDLSERLRQAYEQWEAGDESHGLQRRLDMLHAEANRRTEVQKRYGAWRP
jgi:hypothetical protein